MPVLNTDGVPSRETGPPAELPGESAEDRLPSMRERIITAAADLLVKGGREAVTTRAVSAAAGVQSPTIYRQFGDMRGLLEAVAAQGFDAYLTSKTTRPRAADPVEDLRHAMDHHIAFGLANPAVYILVYGGPRADRPSAPRTIANDILDSLVSRAAEAGRLRVGVARAAAMIQAVGTGLVLTLLAVPPDERDIALAAATRDAVISAITVDDGPGEVSGTADPVVPGSDGMAADWSMTGTVRHAIALRASLPSLGAALTVGERAVMAEWLDRVIESAGETGIRP